MFDRLTDALADRYTIAHELGAGGMATVYLAHDIRHDRDVAIKVLHPELGAALGGDRFLAEIKTTARLQHPHILPLLDSGEVTAGHPERREGPALLYYVMPLMEGETLRALLDREGQLPIDTALRIATEVAGALDYAHRHGVIHRDIKPENILLHDGRAVVADFGIALAVQSAAGARMTQTGLSLGTPQYMSPEQAMGEKLIDARADIYALGAVLYEMLAGEPPFTGPTVQAIVAKVMTERPTPLSTVRETVSPSVEHAVLTALAKLPADRYATAAAFAAALAGGHAGMPGAHTRATSRRRMRDPLVLALAFTTLALAVAMVPLAHRATTGGDDFPFRFELTDASEALTGGATLSPDGKSVVYVGRAPSGPGAVLYLRRLDRLVSRVIPGTNQAGPAAFSPDGKWVVFIANRRKIVKVPLDEGGPAVPLADVADFSGIDWSPNGEIVAGFGILEGLKGLQRVSASGGALTPLTQVDTSRKELSHDYPRVLADGRTVLFTIWKGAVENAELGVTSLDDGKVAPLGILGLTALGVVDGQLVYVRSDGIPMAVPFDARSRTTTGTPRPLQDSIRNNNNGFAAASLSRSGGLLFAHGAEKRRLVWVDRKGVATAALADLREYMAPRIAPDGRHVALWIATGAQSDLWTLDIASGTLTPLTRSGSTRNPVWSGDGRRILYASTQGGHASLWWSPSDGSSAPQQATEPRHNPWNLDLAPDGRTAIYNSLYSGSFNLVALTLDSTRVERELSASPVATEGQGRFSPDGRLVAYNSDESGRPEVYVRPFEGGGRTQVSVDGGRKPVWSRDGSHVYYWEGSRLMSALIARDPAPRVVSREGLFNGRYELDFDVSQDGRFLMIESQTSGLGIVVVPNWRSELRRLTSAGVTP